MIIIPNRSRFSDSCIILGIIFFSFWQLLKSSLSRPHNDDDDNYLQIEISNLVLFNFIPTTNIWLLKLFGKVSFGKLIINYT